MVLADFLTDARQNGWVGDGEKLLHQGVREYGHSEGRLTYQDRYVGNRHDVGIEVVWVDEYPVWGMSYSGGIVGPLNKDAAELHRFLRDCLANPAPEVPVRGPRHACNIDFEYWCEVDGNLGRFDGHERIAEGDTAVYRRRFSGGVVVDSLYDSTKLLRTADH